MTPNKPERKNLSLGATISPVSSYVGKAPTLQTGVSDSLLRLAKNLEGLNPALKTLAEEREKKIMEEGYAEAMEYAEKTGALKEHETFWNKLQTERPEMTSLNPYLKRFLDGKTAENLTLERDNYMKLAYVEKGWVNLDNDAYQKVVEDETAAWYANNKNVIEKLDSREVASKFDKATAGLFASLNNEHLKAETERVVKERAVHLQNDTSALIKDGIPELTDFFNSEKVSIFNLNDKIEENQNILAGFARGSKLMKGLTNLVETYHNQGVAKEDAVLKILDTISQAAVNDPLTADEFIVIGKEFAKDYPAIPKENIETWARTTETEAIKEAKRQDEKTFYQMEVQQEREKLYIRNSFNALGLNNIKNKTGEEVAVMITMPDGSPVPIEYYPMLQAMVVGVENATKRGETEAEVTNYNRLYFTLSTTPEKIDFQDFEYALNSIHPSRQPTLIALYAKNKEDGGATAQKRNQIRAVPIQMAKAIMGAADFSELQKINGQYYLSKQLDALEEELKRMPTEKEAIARTNEAMTNYLKMPAAKQGGFILLEDIPETNRKFILEDDALKKYLLGQETQNGKTVATKTPDELARQLVIFQKNPEELNELIYERYGEYLTDPELHAVLNSYKTAVRGVLEKQLAKLSSDLSPEEKLELSRQRAERIGEAWDWK